ncbi:MAG: radical SAM (seleno)protein TrsS [Dehalococcoidia bacterium]
MTSVHDIKKQQTEEIIGRTQSVCPVCLKRIPAERVREHGCVYLRKTCKEHGDFKTVIWRGEPDYLAWQQLKMPEHPNVCLTEIDKGCPYDCGLCPSHNQQICCALLEVTQRCNLGCPICFANAVSDDPVKDLTLEELMDQMKMVRDTTGKSNIQLSGGEPTMRDDLPDIIRAARSLGYTFFQLNTNGIRLGEDHDYVQALKEAGLSWVFLQFDGTKDEIYQHLRGKSLLAAKEKAIEACGRQQLGVVLVPTLVPGINTDNIGDIVRYALKGMPVIRGVHFQPISYFGRYPVPPEDKDRFTLPEVLRALEEQTDGLLKVADFAPSDCESSVCSFHGDFIYMKDGKLTPSSKKQNTCCYGRGSDRMESVLKSRSFVRNRWRILNSPACCGSENGAKKQDSWDNVLDRIRNYRLSITCMAFQDAENLDIERLQYCCVSIIDKGKTIPFCAYNITSRDGHSLYRGKSTDI